MFGLKPLDVIVSYKKPASGNWPLSRILMRAFDNALLDYGKDLYPHGEIMANHTRIYVGEYPLPMSFEFTTPAPRFDILTPDLLIPPYATICRLHNIGDDPEISKKIIRACAPLQRYVYDIGQLLGMKYRFLRWLDLGRKNMVCSVGVRKIIEDVTGIKPLFGEVTLGKTPPCSFLNSNDFDIIDIQKEL
jgi:hypothetical protein